MDSKESKISVLDEKGGGPWPEEDESQIQNMLEKAGKEIADAIEKKPELKEISKNIEIEITNEGLRIQLIEAGDTAFFDSGSAHLTPKGVEAVAAIAKVVGNLNMDLAVEGHTDSHPLNKNGYTNWELSADRANSARRLLETSGVMPAHIKEVRGYADTKPRYPNAGDPKNRRVSIIVFNKVFRAKMMKGVSEPKLISRKPTVGETHTR
jgi:chemotaxis protein MotB